jgi:glycosyltransferase involved in cell wall biosynthesis
MLATVQPDFVFVYGGAESTLASLAKLARHRFRLIRFRGQAVPCRNLVTQVRHKLGHLGVDAFLAPGDILASSLRPFAGRTAVYPVILGVDTDRFRYTPRFHGTTARPEILVVGRFDPVKGHDAIMRVFQRILLQWPSDALRPRLHFIGQEANIKLAGLRDFARNAGLDIGDDLLITCERHPDMAGAMTHATVGCVPSLGSEIICRVAQEFLLCGTPVAVSGVGSLDEVLFPTAGLTWNGLSEEDTAIRLRELLWNAWHESPVMRETRAAHATALFSLDTMAKSIADVCRRSATTT